MNQTHVFESFNKGTLRLPQGEKVFDAIEWAKHPVFEGVELKHMITSKDTSEAFSYHLVRIAPHHSIGLHTHKTQLETHEVISGTGYCMNNGEKLLYAPGIISIFPADIPHEVHAADEGLYLFAKFIPALC